LVRLPDLLGVDGTVVLGGVFMPARNGLRAMSHCQHKEQRERAEEDVSQRQSPSHGTNGEALRMTAS
jgi:hypothetical protein